MSLAFGSGTACPSLDALLRDQLARPAALNRNVHEDDEMFKGAMGVTHHVRGVALSSYFGAGVQLLKAVRQIVDWRFGGFGEVSALLDFACGYGRLSRFLALELPPERLWVSDIYAGGVAFVAAQLGAHGVVSVVEPEDLRIEQSFDVVVVASLFSHLPHRTFARWLSVLAGLLTPRGALIFSVQGEAVLPPDVVMPPSGLHYVAASESGSLSTTHYGVTWVTEDYVARAIHDATNGEGRYRRLPRAFGHFQDTYVLVRGDDSAFSTLDFRYGPQGFLDRCELGPDGALTLGGWAGDPTPGTAVSEVQVWVEGVRWGGTRPALARPDVVAVTGYDAFAESGFACRGEAPGRIRPGDVLLVKAVSTNGTEYVLHCSTVEEATTFLALQARHAAAMAPKRGMERVAAAIRYHYDRGGVPGLCRAAWRALGRRLARA